MIYVFLANGFEEVEALTPVDILRRAGRDVCTVGVTGKVVMGSHHIPITADVTMEEASFDGIEALILPGGMPGTTNLGSCRALCDLLVRENEKGTLICAICAAPSVLGKLGLLKGKKAICYPGFEKELVGAQVVEAQAVVDGHIITGHGPGAAGDFSFAIVDYLCGHETVLQLKKGMCYAD